MARRYFEPQERRGRRDLRLEVFLLLVQYLEQHLELPQRLLMTDERPHPVALVLLRQVGALAVKQYFELAHKNAVVCQLEIGRPVVEEVDELA